LFCLRISHLLVGLALPKGVNCIACQIDASALVPVGYGDGGNWPMSPEEEQVLRKQLDELRAVLSTASKQIEGAKTCLSPVVAPKQSPTWAWNRERLENPAQFLIALVLGIMGFISLDCRITCLALVTALGVDLFLVILLIEISLRKAINEPFWFEVAHRAYFVLMFGFLLIALVCSFGMLYVSSADIYKGSQLLTTSVDAAYFSLVTITTLGYGDFAPQCVHGRLLVMGELGSGILLLLLIVPVLASRLALLGEGH
jgi:Ion channel